MYFYLFYGSKKVVFCFFWNQNRRNLEKIKLKEKRSMRQLIQTSWGWAQVLLGASLMTRLEFQIFVLFFFNLPTLFESVKVGANEINENRTQRKTPSRRVKGKAGHRIGWKRLRGLWMKARVFESQLDEPSNTTLRRFAFTTRKHFPFFVSWLNFLLLPLVPLGLQSH